MKDGKPVEVFTYFFYVPGHPNVVVTAWTSRSSSNRHLTPIQAYPVLEPPPGA